MSCSSATKQYRPQTSWHPHRRRNHISLPRNLQYWLLDPGSLTQRLMQTSRGDFRVERLHEGWGRATLSEARVLGISPRQKVWVREVHLLGCGEPWVFARSLIPFSTLRGRQRRLRNLGNTPLGAVLFQDTSMRRGPIETARVQYRNQSTWGRRSVFYLENRPLLVNEVFLPALLRLE